MTTGIERPVPAVAATAAWRAEAAAMLRLAVPLVGAQLAQVAMLTTDVLMIGRLGAGPLAAGSLGANLCFIAFVATIGLAMATAPMFAQTLGRAAGPRRRVAVARILREGCIATAAFAVFCSIPLWFAGDLLRLAGQSPALADDAEAYLRWMLWSVVPGGLFVVVRSLLAAFQRTAVVFAVSLAAVLLNVLLDYAFIFGHFGMPAMGLQGAGLTSAAVNWALFLGLAGMMWADRRFRPFLKTALRVRRHRATAAEVVRIGAPIVVILVLEVGFFSAAALMMGRIGTAELAAHAIALQCASVTFMVPFGLSQAATSRVGLAAGAGGPAGAARAGWTALALGGAFMAVAALCFWQFPGTLVGFFLGQATADDARVVAFAMQFLAIAAVFQLVDCAQSIGAGALRGLKDATVPMWLALGGYWAVGFPTGVLLAFAAGQGGTGIWWGFVAGLGVVAVAMLWRFRRLTAMAVGPPLPAAAQQR